MTDYDPRAATGIPTEPVGSLPRPQKLQDAYAAYDRGEIGKAALEEQQDAAVRDSITRQEEAGSPIVSDGEQRWSSFATYPITDTLAGTGLADNLAGDGGQFFAIFADGHGRRLPRLTGGPFRYQTYAADTLAKSVGYAHRPIKQAVIAPSMLYLLYPLEGEIDGYPKEQFERDLADECERDIRQAFAAGASRVSIDFTEGRLATRADPRNPWTTGGSAVSVGPGGAVPWGPPVSGRASGAVGSGVCSGGGSGAGRGGVRVEAPPPAVKLNPPPAW
jgi:methionine synthase II (cobalamin-independent)